MNLKKWILAAAQSFETITLYPDLTEFSQVEQNIEGRDIKEII